MNNRNGHSLLSITIVLLAAVWVNDFLTALVRGEEYGPAGYLVHLAVFTAVVACAVYLRYQHGEALRRLAACRFAWQGLPCAMVVVKAGAVYETLGDAELLRLCTLPQGLSGGEAQKRITVEELRDTGNQDRLIERRIIPLSAFNAGGYTAEVIFDISHLAGAARGREEDYAKMLQILVNMFEMKDPYSHGHSEAVSNLAQDLARALALPRADIAAVARAAILHDIGKIVILPEILNKCEALTPDEREEIQAHASVGADILATFDTFRDEAVIVRHHHERFDGAGYPAKLRGRAIPLGSRIIAVADAFDAMTAGRSVNGRRNVATALAVLEAERGGQFDPLIVDTFISLVKSGRGGR